MVSASLEGIAIQYSHSRGVLGVAMFRRKTDQVYATLQQVQRRISQQTNSGADGLERDITFTPNGMSSASPPRRVSEVAKAVDEPLADDLVPESAKIDDSPLIGAPIERPYVPSSQPGTGRIQSGHPSQPGTGRQIASAAKLPAAWQSTNRRPALHLPWELASLIFLMWLGSLVGVFFIGHHFGGRALQVASGPNGGGEQLRVERGSSESSAATTGVVTKRLLILASVAKANGETETRFREDAKRLNAYAEQNAQSGYRSWFGVRKPSNGGLQLVFGMVNGVVGVDAAHFSSLVDVLIRAGYKDARWIDVP